MMKSEFMSGAAVRKRTELSKQGDSHALFIKKLGGLLMTGDQQYKFKRLVDYLNVVLRSRYSGLAGDMAIRYYNSAHTAGNYRITVNGVKKCLNKIIASENRFTSSGGICSEEDVKKLLEICTHQYPMLDSVASYPLPAKNVLLHLNPERSFYYSVLKSIKQQLEENNITDVRLTQLIIDCADGDLSYFIVPTGFQLLLDGGSFIDLTGAKFTQDQIKYTVKIHLQELKNENEQNNLIIQIKNIVLTLQTIVNDHPDKNKLVMAFVGHILSQNPQYLDAEAICYPFEGQCLSLLELLQPLMENFHFRSSELSNPEELRNFVIMANFLIRFYSAQGEIGLQNINLLLDYTLLYRLREDNAGYILLIYNCQKILQKDVNDLVLTHYSEYLKSCGTLTIAEYCRDKIYWDDNICNVYCLLKKDHRHEKKTIAIVIDSEYLCNTVFCNIFKFSQVDVIKRTKNSCLVFEKINVNEANEANKFVIVEGEARNNLPQILEGFPLLKYITISNDRIISFLKLLKLKSFEPLFINAAQLDRYDGNLCVEPETRVEIEAIFFNLLINKGKAYSLEPNFLQQVKECYSTKEPSILAQVYFCLAATLIRYNSLTFFATGDDSIHSLRIIVSCFLKEAVKLDKSIFKGQTSCLKELSLNYFVRKLEGDDCTDGIFIDLLSICRNKCKDKIDGRWIIDETIPSAWR